MPRLLPFEAVFASAMLAVTLAITGLRGLPILIPSWDCAGFLGLHYLAPLCAVIAWCVVLYRRPSQVLALTVMLACLVVVLWCHFQLKMIAPLLNPMNLDPLLWSLDGRLRLVVDVCFFLRASLAAAVPYETNMYMWAFIALFYLSFILHFVFTPHAFRRVFLAILILQGLGALGYVALPAVGPFLYEQGLNPLSTRAQHYMLANRADLLAGGAAWLQAHGSRVFLAGLGAMPSLHAGCSFVFLWYAAASLRWLVPAYLVAFVFILVTAVATRWHYLVDLPVGILFALAAVRLADAVDGRTRDAKASRAAAGSLAPVRVPEVGDALPLPA